MTLEEKLIKEFQQLSESQKRQVLDFVESLKTKNQEKIENMMDEVIMENREALEELAK